MRLGFIGTGMITEAIVTGLCQTTDTKEEMRVSPRNEARAGRLCHRYDRVCTAPDNQAVVDDADMVFLAFLPGMEREILAPLRFRPDQIVVTLLAGTAIDTIAPLVRLAKTVVRAIPLPCTALCTGPVVMFPDHETVKDLFSRVGNVIVPAREGQLETFSLITALMAPFYAFTHTAASWGAAQGLDPVQSSAYTAAMFKALSLIAEQQADGNIHQLVTGCMTPGGLNETAMAHMSEQGGFSMVPSALDAVRRKFA